MTLPDPTDVIAPRDDLPYQRSDFFREMMEGAYPDDVVLKYHSLMLYSRCQDENGARLYDVYTADEAYVETVNLNALRTITELEQLLDEMVAYDPDDREEWVSSR